MIYNIVYYKDKRGKEPVADWINDPRNANIKVSVRSRITDLINLGPNLSDTKLPPIQPRRKNEARIHGFYELKNQSKGKGWRIAVYYDLDEKQFVLLCGWRKTQSVQPQDIDRAYTLLHDYLDRKKG